MFCCWQLSESTRLTFGPVLRCLLKAASILLPYSVFASVFTPKWAGSPKRQLGITGAGLRARRSSVTQPTVTKNWTKPGKTTYRPHPSLIHQLTTEGTQASSVRPVHTINAIADRLLIWMANFHSCCSQEGSWGNCCRLIVRFLQAKYPSTSWVNALGLL